MTDRDAVVSGRTRRGIREVEQTDEQPEQNSTEVMLARILEEMEKNKQEGQDMMGKIMERQEKRDDKMWKELKLIKEEVGKIDVLKKRMDTYEIEYEETKVKVAEIETKVEVINTILGHEEEKVREVEEKVHRRIDNITEEIAGRALQTFKTDSDLWKKEVERNVINRTKETEDKVGYKVDEGFDVFKKHLEEHKRSVETKFTELQAMPGASQGQPVIACTRTDVKAPTYEGKESENPIKYLESLRNYFLLQPTAGEHQKALIAGYNLLGEARRWWEDIQMEVTTFADFQERFRFKFWNEGRQDKVRDKLLSGRYKNERGASKEEYARRIIRDVLYLDVLIPERDGVRLMLKHFDENTRTWARMQEVKTYQDLYGLVKNISLDEPQEERRNGFEDTDRRQNWRPQNRGKYNFRGAETGGNYPQDYRRPNDAVQGRLNLVGQEHNKQPPYRNEFWRRENQAGTQPKGCGEKEVFLEERMGPAGDQGGRKKE